MLYKYGTKCTKTCSVILRIYHVEKLKCAVNVFILTESGVSLIWPT